LKYYDNNIASLLNVLQVMQWRGVKDLVFSSSCTVYGQPSTMPVDETAPDHDANSPYGYTKVVGERMIRDMGRSDDAFKAVLLRYFNPIGAHPEGHIGEQPNDAPSNLVPFITQTAAGLRERLVIHGSDYDTPDGTCMRDFVHVQDVARAHVMALEWMAGRTAPLCEAFNLGAGEGHSVKKVVDTFEEVSGVRVPHVLGPRRPGDIAAIWADTSKSRTLLGWRCEHDLRSALRDAWNWQRSVKRIGPQ
jgi:UDP-glucose 4-epimerase